MFRVQAVTFSPHTALAVLRSFLPSPWLLQKQPKCPYPNITDIVSLQIISPSNSPDKVTQAATKSQPQTSSVGKILPSWRQEGRTRQGRCLASGALAGGPGTSGENREFWALFGGGREGRGISLSPPTTDVLSLQSCSIGYTPSAMCLS